MDTYWPVGKSLVEFEQTGSLKAEYGKELLVRLSKDLKSKYSKGFSRSNLQYMRLLYVHYPKRQTLSGKLSWSHYVELLSISDDAGRSFYEKQCLSDTWSVRELKRQRNASLFERIALTRDQMAFVDIMDANNRALCSGGAGTGKTLLAMELARRWTCQNKRVVIPVTISP